MARNVMRYAAALAAVVLLALGGAVTATPASALTGTVTGTPPWVAGDTFRKGAVTFFDATTGDPVRGGSNINAMNVYLGTSGADPRDGANKVTSFLAAPDPTNTVPVTWATSGIQSSTTFIPTPAGTPDNVVNTGGAYQKLTPANEVIQDTSTGLTLSSAAGYANVLEIRMQDSGVGVAPDGGKYWATDIVYNRTSATSSITVYGLTLAPGEWGIISPVPSAVSTFVGISPSPTSGNGNNETNIKFTAFVSNNAGGTVVFTVDGVPFGSSKPIVGQGTVDSDFGQIPAGNHTVMATFMPVAAVGYQLGYASSAMTIANYNVYQLVHPTTTNVSVAAATVNQPDPVTGTAVVTNNDNSANVSVGQAAFYLDGATTPFATDTTGANGFTFVLGTSGLSIGNHSVTASFSDGASFFPSTSSAVVFRVAPPIYPPDVQAVDTVIPPGTLVISTPYTSTNPLHLGAMTLSSTATGYTASGAFADIIVTDTRPGNLPYTLSALASNFYKTGVASPTNAQTINSQNVGLTSLVKSAAPAVNNVLPATFLGSQVPGSSTIGQNLTAFDYVAGAWLDGAATGSAGLGGPSPHAVLHANSGLGTTTLNGVLTIKAPTNTLDGTYAGTVTFTIIGS